VSSLETVIIAGAVSFGAAIAGAATGGRATFRLERRREQGQARAGARVVRQELKLAAQALHKVVKDHSYTSTLPPSWPAWEQHRAIIAMYLSAETWNMIASTIDDVVELSPAFEACSVPRCVALLTSESSMPSLSCPTD